MIGGYKIIDLNNVEISSEGGMVTVEGIYNKIAETKLPIMLTNFKIDDETIKGRYSDVCKVGNAYLLNLGFDTDSLNFLMVDEEDRVSYLEINLGGSSYEPTVLDMSVFQLGVDQPELKSTELEYIQKCDNTISGKQPAYLYENIDGTPYVYPILYYYVRSGNVYYYCLNHEGKQICYHIVRATVHVTRVVEAVNGE